MRMVEIQAIDHAQNRELRVHGVQSVRTTIGKNGYVIYHITYMYNGEIYQHTISSRIWDEIRFIHF